MGKAWLMLLKAFNMPSRCPIPVVMYTFINYLDRNYIIFFLYSELLYSNLFERNRNIINII